MMGRRRNYLNSYTLYLLAILVGFEFTTYTFEEPEFQSFRREEVCLLLSTGRVDQTYRFRVQWNPITAAQGTPGVGGDYVPQSTEYVLDPGVQRACIEIFIQRDNAFERREEFTGQISTVQLPDGTLVSQAPGVTVSPDSTRIFIDNIDRKFTVKEPFFAHT